MISVPSESMADRVHIRAKGVSADLDVRHNPFTEIVDEKLRCRNIPLSNGKRDNELRCRFHRNIVIAY